MLRQLTEAVANALPSQCAVCHAWPARPVCESCVVRFAQPSSRCRRCAIEVAAGIPECGRCLAHPPVQDACFAALAYAYPWSTLIAQFKFNGQAGWAGTFATLMRSSPWVEPALEEADLVLPMPLSAERLAERGFNQALLLARALAARKADGALLLRVRHTPAQAALDLKQRKANVEGAFAVDPLRSHELRGRKVVLVDDVMTSGASAASAGEVLRRAGASKLTVLVLARTPAPD